MRLLEQQAANGGHSAIEIWDEHHGVTQRIRFDQFADRMLASADWLQRQQLLLPGGTCAVLAQNSLDYLSLSLGAMTLGGRAAHLNWRQPADVTSTLLQRMQASLLLYDDDQAQSAAQVAKELGLRASHLEAASRERHGQPPLHSSQQKPLVAQAMSVSASYDAIIFFTGGTTGTPKGVPHSHSGLLWLADTLLRAFPGTEREGTLCFAPFFHVMGCVANWVFNLNAGVRAFLLASHQAVLSAELLARALVELRPSTLNTVPWVVQGLCQMLQRSNESQLSATLSSLALITYGGAALPPSSPPVLRAHGINVACTYGQTEVGGPVMFGKLNGDPDLLRPLPGCSYRLLADDEPQRQEAAREGELLLLGVKSAMAGYLGVARPSGAVDNRLEYGTHDVFAEERLEDGSIWLRYLCREDDVLVHTSGEMTNPVVTELSVLGECASIASAVVLVGNNQPRPSLLVELAVGLDPTAPATLASLHAARKAANDKQPGYSAVLPQDLHPLPHGSLMLTVKGTPQRRKAEEALQTLLQARAPKANRVRGTAATVHAQVEPAMGEKLVLDAISAVIGLSPTGFAPSLDEGLMEAGIDSLLVSDLMGAVEASCGIALLPTIVFEHPTPRALANHLTTVCDGAGPVHSPAALALHQHGAAQICLHRPTGRWAGGCTFGVQLDRCARASGNAVTSVPSQRWCPQEQAEFGSGAQNVVLHSGFISGATRFDNRCFRISPAEAAAMDPQQRLLLELSYEAFSLASQRREALHGSNTGIFVALEAPDWARMLPAVSGTARTYEATSTTCSIASGRLSFVLGLHGMCVSIDTACSSSLVAVHSAELALRQAIALSVLQAAIRMILMPHSSLVANAAGMLSADGRCKTWDARSNGYVRAEGGGALLLQVHDWSSSQRPHMQRGSAVRQDGRSASLTAPNGSAQRVLILAALSLAEVSSEDVGRLEAHGTGTALGDPTEVGALIQTSRQSSGGLPLGGSKASCGHAEGGSGMLGLEQLLLNSLATTGNTQLRTLNPLAQKLLSAVSPVLSFVTQSCAPSKRPCGGASSFGYSGTIAHAVLQHVRARHDIECKRVTTMAREHRFRRSTFSWRRSTPGRSRSGEDLLYAAAWCSLEAPKAGSACEAAVLAVMTGLEVHSSSKRMQPNRMQQKSQGQLAAVAAVLSQQGRYSFQPLAALVAALTLVQGQAARATPLAVWLLCCSGSQTSPSSWARASHASTWGLARVARAETMLAVLCINAPIVQAVTHGVSLTEMESILRPSAHTASRLTRVAGIPMQNPRSKPSMGWQLITGGSGGLGLLTARWLGQRGARAIALASRSAAFTRDVAIVEWQALQASSTTVLAVRCDTAQVAHVRCLVARTPSLAGAWHAAGVNADRVLPSQTAASAALVYAPKAHGAWTLQMVSTSMALDTCTLFSSVAALLGGAGQTNYSSASVSLDALASCRRLQGTTSVSVQWGAWAEVGMAARGAASGRLLAMHAKRIGLAEGLAALAVAVQRLSPSVLGVLPIVWSRMFSGGTAAVPAFLCAYAPLASETAAEAICMPVSPTCAISLKAVLEMVQRAAGGKVDVDASLEDSGVDSLGAIELRNQLQSVASEGILLPGSLIIDHPTVRLLAKALKSKDEPMSDCTAATSGQAEESSEDGKGFKPRQVRIMMLHGDAADGVLLQQMMTGMGWLSKSVNIDFIFPNGPHSVEARPHLYQRMHEAGLYGVEQLEYYSWQIDEWQGCELSVRYLTQLLRVASPPIDGVGGICDGSGMALAMAALNPTGSLGLYLNICGPPPSRLAAGLLRKLSPDAVPIRMPSLHLFGEADEMYSMTQLRSVLSLCEAPSTVLHKLGHQVPKMNAEIAAELALSLRNGREASIDRIESGIPLATSGGDPDVEGGEEEEQDSMHLISKATAATEQDLTIANIYGFLTIYVAHFHWTFRASPTGALDWAHVNSAAPRFFVGVFNAETSAQPFVNLMDLFVLCTGVLDRKRGLSWTSTARFAKLNLSLIYVIFGTKLTVGLHALYELTVGKEIENKCLTMLTVASPTWFLASLTIVKIVVFALSSVCGLLFPRQATWLVPVLCATIHFASFSDRLPWPFVRLPLNDMSTTTGVTIARRLPNMDYAVITFLVWYSVAPPLLPRSFPAVLPGEISRGPSTTTFSRVQRVAVRGLWAVSPFVLRRILYVPNLNYFSLPYVAMPCAKGARAAGKGCAIIALQALKSCSVFEQWSTGALLKDAYSSVLMLTAMCGYTAFAPRRRIPMLTTIGEQALLCYLSAPIMHYYFAPFLQHIINGLVWLGVVSRTGPTLLMPVVYPAFLVGFWIIATAMREVPQKMGGCLGKIGLFGAVSLPTGLVLLLAMALYDPQPSMCESAHTDNEVIKSHLPQLKNDDIVFPSCTSPLPKCREVPHPIDGSLCSSCVSSYHSCRTCKTLMYDCSCTAACSSAITYDDSSFGILPMQLFQSGRRPNAEAWRRANPGLSYVWMDPMQARIYLSEAWGEAYALAYDSLKHSSSRSQFVGLCYVADRGGFYAHRDTCPGAALPAPWSALRALTMTSAQLVLALTSDFEAKETVSNGFFGAAARHPATLLAAQRAMERIQRKLVRRHGDPRDVTSEISGITMLKSFASIKGALLLATNVEGRLTRPNACRSFERHLLRSYLGIAPKPGRGPKFSNSSYFREWYASSCRPRFAGVWPFRNLTVLPKASLASFEARVNVGAFGTSPIATRCPALRRRNSTILDESLALLKEAWVGDTVYRGCSAKWRSCRGRRTDSVLRLRRPEQLNSLLGGPLRCVGDVQCDDSIEHDAQQREGEKETWSLLPANHLLRRGWLLSGAACKNCPHPAQGVTDGFACMRLCAETAECDGWVHNTLQQCYLKSKPLVWQTETWANGTSWAGFRPSTGVVDAAEHVYVCKRLNPRLVQRSNSRLACHESSYVYKEANSMRFMRGMLAPTVVEPPVERPRTVVKDSLTPASPQGTSGLTGSAVSGHKGPYSTQRSRDAVPWSIRDSLVAEVQGSRSSLPGVKIVL